jgi:hypothetical protein
MEAHLCAPFDSILNRRILQFIQNRYLNHSLKDNVDIK